MPTTTKRPANFGRLAGKGILLGLLLTGTGCVAESPHGYYGSYPGDYSYYNTYTTPGGNTVVAPPGSTVVIRHEYADPNRYPVQNYDDHWDYGRRGNGNFHGTGDDDVHDD